MELFTKKQYNLMLKRGKPQTYGKVLVISTKTVKNVLFVLENVIPMTFFTLSILGSYIYKKTGYKELYRIPLRD